MSSAWTTTLRCLLAAGSGALLFFSYEPFGYWVLALVAMALFYAALAPWPNGARPSARLGAGLGMLQALVPEAVWAARTPAAAAGSTILAGSSPSHRWQTLKPAWAKSAN